MDLTVGNQYRQLTSNTIDVVDEQRFVRYDKVSLISRIRQFFPKDA
jgi:hypothetical protein